jgi:hypothetical protein
MVLASSAEPVGAIRNPAHIGMLRTASIGVPFMIKEIWYARYVLRLRGRRLTIKAA